MFKKLIKNKKAQQTAEYALLISLVVAAVIAMQTYAQRALQGRIRDASRYLVTQTSWMGETNQYEPYYLRSSYDITRDEVTSEQMLEGGRTTRDQVSNRARLADGYQASSFNASQTTGW